MVDNREPTNADIMTVLATHGELLGSLTHIVDRLELGQIKIGESVDVLTDRVDTLEKNQRAGFLDLSGRMDYMEQRMDSLETEVHSLSDTVGEAMLDLDGRVTTLEAGKAAA